MAERQPPVDACAEWPGFSQFRENLRRIVAAKDATALTNLLADDVVVDFGGGKGKATFEQAWTLDRPQESKLWDEMRQAMALGCAKVDRFYVMPDLLTELPYLLDSSETVVAFPGARLRAAPDDNAQEIASLDWHLLKVTESPDVSPWLAATTIDGRTGFVRSDQVRSPLDYRLTIEKRGGKWMIVGFAAGD